MYAPTCVDLRGMEYPGPDVFGAADEDFGVKSPYRVGGVLWVRESLYFRNGSSDVVHGYEMRDPATLHYVADDSEVVFETEDQFNAIARHGNITIPSIHMPRWASRIMLRVTGVRVERVQSISAADIRAEGLVSEGESFGEKLHRTFEEAWFVQLWDSIHGRGAWERNDFCWVFDFERTA